MPNVQPEQLPIPPVQSRRGWPCANLACVEIKPDGTGGFTFTSTIAGNDGSVTYTEQEVRQFFSDVKAGHWDHLLG
jgi:hypothetical protein